MENFISKLGWAIAGAISIYFLMGLFDKTLGLGAAASGIFPFLIVGGIAFYHHYKIGQAEARSGK